MQIKKFYGDNIQEVMNTIKKELGDKAVILHTKKVKKGKLFGIIKKEQIEVLAALENETSNDYAIKPKANIQIEEHYEPKQHFAKDDITSLKKEINELKSYLRTISNKVTINFDDETNIKEELKDVYNKLRSKGVSSHFIESMLSEIDISDNKNTSLESKIEKYVINKFSSYTHKFQNKINIFIGPTGVGKTTTLAKLASESVLINDKKIAFLTLDTYRIGAVDQLKVYAEILNCPIEVVYDIQDIKVSLERLKNRDLIFVDTAGRSHKNKRQMQELKDMLNEINNKDIYLVINANWNIDDIKDIIKEYSFVEDYKIIVTKLDETSRFGIILDILSVTNKSIAYTTFGQNVPDDIEHFDISKYINELLKG
ncbi:flagellar biosynthesis protein FlhF [Alkalithermobacter thermoalcaliphilus JW-YL-7 = DSM 7308]|uniref:Flagellar biosynthesis protein FlhF n=1 Tax=Alkalithermobacter thermoalcaliphilus JW-YL-7 = DSM 7308 TaxID=1121328 RepID=A0A150FQE0_CLOPD|nr:flagellar biosynthetic protein FlhF [[Clostridium] paradoxum JW-YL-7 = DSM 7308]SHK60592.1 flagellar biosynthesis protein FlhF [[Clostridium] paradoxum JW-YL-7 = DSM 7308]